jgi:hypothetical protein
MTMATGAGGCVVHVHALRIARRAVVGFPRPSIPAAPTAVSDPSSANPKRAGRRWTQTTFFPTTSRSTLGRRRCPWRCVARASPNAHRPSCCCCCCCCCCARAVCSRGPALCAAPHTRHTHRWGSLWKSQTTAKATLARGWGSCAASATRSRCGGGGAVAACSCAGPGVRAWCVVVGVHPCLRMAGQRSGLVTTQRQARARTCARTDNANRP